MQKTTPLSYWPVKSTGVMTDNCHDPQCLTCNMPQQFVIGKATGWRDAAGTRPLYQLESLATFKRQVIYLRNEYGFEVCPYIEEKWEELFDIEVVEGTIPSGKIGRVSIVYHPERNPELAREFEAVPDRPLGLRLALGGVP